MLVGKHLLQITGLLQHCRLFEKIPKFFGHGKFEFFVEFPAKSKQFWLLLDKTWKNHENLTSASFRKDDFCCKKPAICSNDPGSRSI